MSSCEEEASARSAEFEEAEGKSLVEPNMAAGRFGFQPPEGMRQPINSRPPLVEVEPPCSDQQQRPLDDGHYDPRFFRRGLGAERGLPTNFVAFAGPISFVTFAGPISFVAFMGFIVTRFTTNCLLCSSPHISSRSC